MVESVDVDLGSCNDLGGHWLDYVARFAKVVPGDDLHIVGQDLQDLLPTGEPEGIAARVPVLAILREVCVTERVSQAKSSQVESNSG